MQSSNRLSDIFKKLSELPELEELQIELLIDIKPEFMAKRVFSSSIPFQLTSVRRLVLDEERLVAYETAGADLHEFSKLKQSTIDGLAWCKAIHSVFPNLEELSVCTAFADRKKLRLKAIEEHVNLLGLRKFKIE